MYANVAGKPAEYIATLFRLHSVITWTSRGLVEACLTVHSDDYEARTVYSSFDETMITLYVLIRVKYRSERL